MSISKIISSLKLNNKENKYIKSLSKTQKNKILEKVDSKAKSIFESFKNIISILIIITIVFGALFMKYVTDLESDKCDCSDSFDRNFIKYYSVVFIIIQFTRLVLFNRFTFSFKNLPVVRRPNLLTFIFTFLNFYYLFTLYRYTNHLKNKECDCSKNWIRKLMHTYSFVIILLLVFIIFIDLIRCVIN